MLTQKLAQISKSSFKKYLGPFLDIYDSGLSNPKADLINSALGDIPTKPISTRNLKDNEVVLHSSI